MTWNVTSEVEMREAMLSKNLLISGARSDLGSVLLDRTSALTGTKILAVSRSRMSERLAESATVKRLSGIDLCKESDLCILANAVSEFFDEPFSIVHSVGNFWTHKPLIDTTLNEMAEMFSSQVLTLFGAVRFLTPIMLQNGGGRVVTFSCNSVCYSYPDMSPFTASKAAVESFIKCFANEHAEHGVSAFAVALPTVRTQKVLAEKSNSDQANLITPEDVADFVVHDVLTLPHHATGNVLKVFKHSPTFYGSGFFQRNPRQ